nr:immunoglobulin heavy chain junction region [Macaca mulatta]MOV43809.1 immunoglobulin heavy chain junction region [Macaca mulatta]MOV44925.1 immunoglobulin heavy chain junction region [Macaca mulatta]MOV47276.1 immunoglobulin heavy chain junction region [Macaca mulatta]MOV47292.1 immunoglobulin heavy chain junction region [Macaca mulatta]
CASNIWAGYYLFDYW